MDDVQHRKVSALLVLRFPCSDPTGRQFLSQCVRRDNEQQQTRELIRGERPILYNDQLTAS
jgi:hypothetical protein